MLEIKLGELVHTCTHTHTHTHTHYDNHQIDGNIWQWVTSESSRVHCERMKTKKGKSWLMVFMDICLTLHSPLQFVSFEAL